MKKSIKFLLALFIMSAVFVGCEKDKDEDNDDGNNNTETQNNYFSYDNIDYDLTQGFSIGYGEDEPGIYNMDIMLASSGLKFHEVNGQVDSVSGNGDIIIMELLTSQASSIDLGVYPYSDGVTPQLKTMIFGAISIGYDANTEEPINESEIESGTLTVKESGTIIELEFDFIDENGKAVKGYYKGTNKYYDESGNKGAKKSFF